MQRDIVVTPTEVNIIGNYLWWFENVH